MTGAAGGCGGETYIVRLSAWAPGIENPGEWDEWAQGKRDISHNAKGPEISFTDPLFRRRLSQISKMTIQVVHDLMPLGENTKILFLSFRGEQCRQFQINKTLIEEKSVSPAAFSLSVYNAPAALAAIAFGLKGGYSALYPAKDSFAAGLKAAEAMLFSGAGTADKNSPASELVFVYADETAPPEFECYSKECPPPAAFGLLLSGTPRPPAIPLSAIKTDEDNPLAFIRQLLLSGGIHVSS